MEEYSPRLQRRTLKGHRGPVLCLAHSRERLAHYPPSLSAPSGQSLLLSGSEDGTVRLWDLRLRRTALCMTIPRGGEDDGGTEVTAVSFHPSISISEEAKRDEMDKVDDRCSGADAAAPFFPLQCDCTVYASTANRVYGYDLRRHSEVSTSPIVKTPHFDLTSVFGCTDEINQLSFSFPRRNDGGNNYLLVAADDSGEARVIESPPFRHNEQSPNSATPERGRRTFRHAERETMGITSSAAFRPRTNNDAYLATGGTDCTVKLWDASRPRRPTSTVQIKPTEGESTTRLCNPPYVHSLSWSPSGRLLAAGAGDGSCVILRAEGRRLTEAARLGRAEGGHAGAVAAVRFAAFGLCDDGDASIRPTSKSRKTGEAEDRLLISAGNDGNVIFWDIGRDVVGSAPLDPVSYLGGCLSPPDTGWEGTSSDDGKLAANALGSLNVSNNGDRGKEKCGDCGDKDFDRAVASSPPRVLFKIAHRQKPNWTTCSRASDTPLPVSLFVADTTSNISIYSLPI